MRILLIVFSLLGLADSTFLVWDSLSMAENCGALLARFGIATCSNVTESVYGTFLGYPISIFGMIAYTSIGVLTYMGRNDENYRKGIFIIASGGFLISLFLTVVQWRILESWCFFCLLSAVLMTLLFLISIAFLGSVSRQVKKRRHDLKISLKTFILISILVLGIFEAIRGRILYHHKLLEVDSTPISLPGQDIWIGMIDERFISLFEVNALAGAVEPEYRKRAFDYMVLMKESEVSDLTLAEMITNETTLRLFPPQAAQTSPPPLPVAEEIDLETQDDASLIIENEEISDSNQGATSTVLTKKETYEERQFKAYLKFLERAEQKNNLEIWEQYLTTLKIKHRAREVFP